MMTSLSSVSSALSSDSLTRLFQKADANGDNTLSQDELLNALNGAEGSTGTSDSVASLFADMDSNGDGTLTQKEFSSFTQMFSADSAKAVLAAQEGDDRSEETGSASTGGAGEAAGRSSQSYDPLDTNEDGTVSASERAAGERDSFGLLNGSTLGTLMQFNEVAQAA